MVYTSINNTKEEERRFLSLAVARLMLVPKSMLKLALTFLKAYTKAAVLSRVLL